MPTLLQSKDQGATKPLSERLLAIAKSLPRGGIVCDIGSDHGILPMFLLKNSYCRFCIVTDLNEAPLNRARKCLGDAGVSSFAEFLLADGIPEKTSTRPDCYVVAGMGGETISGILERGKERIDVGDFFALQPMTREVHLRKYLYENGFLVEKERIVFENGKCFPIFFARYDGINRKREESFYFLGEHLTKMPQKENVPYFQKLLASVQVRLKGKRDSGSDCFAEEEWERQLLKQLEVFHEDSGN